MSDELIRRQDVLDTLCKTCGGVGVNGCGVCGIDYPCDETIAVGEILSVDAVEVVRCKDCKHWHEDVANNFTSIPRGGCKLVRGLTNGDFFCALGERKEINSR